MSGGSGSASWASPSSWSGSGCPTAPTSPSTSSIAGFETIRDSAYAESSDLAARKGSFPRFDPAPYGESGYVHQLSGDTRAQIEEHGIRNVTLLTVAPTGTTGTMMATSTGIEPYFMFRFERRGRLGSHLVNEAVVSDFLRSNDMPEDSELPPQFVTTEDLEPEHHAAIMAVAQRYVDSAISKTCNLPHDFTVDQVKDFYRRLYELGCKGGTVYRDRSREEQVLVKLPEDETAPEPPRPRTAINPVKALPKGPRLGFTDWVQTPIGRVHVTLNVDPANPSQPFDVFVTLSKAGSDTDADTDAMGRLLSLLLRLDVELPARQRLELAIEQLRGIATSRAVGFGPDRIRSVPDGIARCLEKLLEHLDTAFAGGESIRTLAGSEAPAPSPEAQAGGNGQPQANGSAFMQLCPQCGNATAANVDGCFKCFSCDFSEC